MPSSPLRPSGTGEGCHQAAVRGALAQILVCRHPSHIPSKGGVGKPGLLPQSPGKPRFQVGAAGILLGTRICSFIQSVAVAGDAGSHRGWGLLLRGEALADRADPPLTQPSLTHLR